MQSANPTGTRVRFLYYWAKCFADTMGAGGNYADLRKCTSILWFKEPLLPTRRLHSVFRLRENHGTEVFAQEIEFHVLELPKLGLAKMERQARLERWARFFRAKTAEELEALAREDDIMTTAKQTLEQLSGDSRARRLAREREMAMVAHRHLLAASRREGREEGREEGIRAAVRSVCEVLSIELTVAREQDLGSRHGGELDALLLHLKTERAWPETT